MKKYVVLLTLGLLAGCGGKSEKLSLDNACALVSERPQYYRAMKRVEQRWGVPVPVQMATIHQESKFVGDARTPHQYLIGLIPIGRQSSAYGYSQALDGTWEEYKAETGNSRAKRNDIKDATDFMGWYMNGSTKALGISKADARAQYLAYHEGRGGYRRGTYRAKGWLMAVSARVQQRANMYRAQLQSCGKT